MESKILLIVIGIAITSFLLGSSYKQTIVERRALEMNKSYYDSYDLEYILRGEKDGLKINHAN